MAVVLMKVRDKDETVLIPPGAIKKVFMKKDAPGKLFIKTEDKEYETEGNLEAFYNYINAER